MLYLAERSNDGKTLSSSDSYNSSVVVSAAYHLPVYESQSDLFEGSSSEQFGIPTLLDTLDTLGRSEEDSLTPPDTAAIQVPSESGDTLNPSFPIHWSEPPEKFPAARPSGWPQRPDSSAASDADNPEPGQPQNADTTGIGLPAPSDSLDAGVQESPTSQFRQTFRLPYRGDGVARPWMRPYPRLYYIALPGESVTVRRLPGGNYLAVRSYDGREAWLPGLYTFRQYADEARRVQMRENWAGMIREASRQGGSEASLLDFRFDVPGGRESAFTTFFGRPEINLRVNGMANMNVGASVQHVADPSLPPDQQTRVDPRFDQNLQLNIQGTIGDKLTIRTDWDTERTFDYQNLLHISYQGYEDEILKEVEMGNVSMQTGNSLIRGSESLFGIRSMAELGSFRLTSVLSQQKGESNVQTITGGEQEQQIRLHPADYQNNRHFFLDFYTRQEFELSMSDPQQRIQTLPFAEINVWVLTDQVQADEGARLAVALSDYGVVENPDGSYSPPDNELDPFDEQQLQPLRDPSVGITASDLGLSDSRNYEEGYFRLLREGEDYTVDRVSGFISLNQSLSSREVLAVSFTYQGEDGQTVSVGDMTQGGSERIFLKMLRPRNLATDHRTFPLTMRNVYSLGVSDLRQENVELELLFTEGNVAQNQLPGRSTTLLEDLGLDRVDSQGGLEPDNRVDFGTGTLDAVSGRVIFPWLEPFGERLEQLLREGGALEEEVERLSYNELYSEQQRNAERASANSFYRMSGTVRGGAQENFTLDFALVEGSVRVYANGMELQEGVDYQVDYSFGSITILNDRYTAAGQEIRIEYENQSLTSIEQKTFTGLRAEYQLARGMSVGGTWFRYMERPLDDKIRIGDEPINNMMLGFDTSMDLDLPFLTEWMDALPVLSTRERSGVTFSGEFAQLFPGVSQTRAVDRAIDNNELYPDEENGVSFVDDFEGSSVRINLLNPIRWHLAAAPAAIPGYEPDMVWFEEDLQVPGSSPLDVQADRADLRSAFAWYSIPRNITSILDGVDYTPESQQVRVEDVFPGRQNENPQEEFITTMDVWFNPGERGPYNYNRQIRELLEETPERTWGGMTTVLPSGQEDFSQNNIEFLEFWVQPLLTGGREPSPTELESYEGTIYVDIGTISEDVVPNAKLNSEDGLATNPEQLVPDRAGNPRSYIPATQPPPEGQFSTSNRHLEDVGLDGLPATDGVGGRSERIVFSDFVETMRTVYEEDSEEFQAIFRDPSNDQYRFYGEDELEGLPLHERFHRMLGYYEGNTPIDQSDRRAVTNRPNTEGLVNPGRVELDNAYFQYEMEFNPGDPEHNYIVDRVSGPRPDQRWYQVRIPLDDFVRQVGDISDFQNISYIRIWMSGYEEPFTLRFATLDFIGSQWQKAESVNRQSDPGADLNVTTLNIEENSNRRPVPYRQPRGGIRAQNRGSQLQSLQNEQSIVLEAEGLGPGGVQLVRRNFPGGLNLLHYSNLRMFVHGEGFDRRGDAELVMRFGNDLENSYYEYRQPVTPSDVDYPWQSYDPAESGRMELEAEQVWLYEENSMNILLQAFNQLKQLRDQASGDLSIRYERSDLLEGAVPGAVIAVKGNPSLDRVNEIGMGIRNPFDPENPSGPGVPSLYAQLWMNELRVSGFDNRAGWAANAKTSLQLADVVMLNTTIEQQTDGFGSLNSRLGDRRMSDQLAWDLNTTLYLDRFLPERYGWSIPVSFTTRRSTLTPRYLPNEGDIRLDDFKQAIRSREDLSSEVQDELIRQRVFDIQTYSEFYSLNLSNLTKRNSDGWLARYTLDNTTFNYVYNTTDARNPQNQFQDSWNFNTSLRYSHSFRETRFVTPLGFMEGVPVAGLISGLSVGLLPNQISASIRMNRMYEERRRRSYGLNQEAEPLQQTHNFGYQTSFGFGYNLLRSITTTFQADGGFDLNRISQREGLFSGPDSTVYKVRPSFRVLEDLLTDDRVHPRRSTYQESYTAAWQPRIDKIRSLDWVTYSLRYGGGFRWENAPYESNLGARVANSFRMDHTLRLETEQLLERWGLFEGVREAEERAGSSRPAAGENEDGEGSGFGEMVASAGRRTLLGLVSLRSIELGYNDSKTGSQAGYSGGSGFFDQFGSGPGSSPSFLYRTGFDERLGLDRLVGNPDSDRIVQFPSNNSYSDQLTLRARFQPFRTVSVDLTWEANWDERTTESVSFSEGERQTVSGASGNVGSSVWAFGPGYRDLFERQVQTGFDGIVADADSIGRVDGRLLMNRLTLQEDFRSAYLGGEGTVGGKGFMPFPMPGWRINWMGIEELIPVLGSYMQGASITHAYTGRYRLGWGFNSNPGELSPRRIGSYVVSDERSEFEPTSVNVERRFAPLVQLTITWDRNLRTRIGYEVSRMTSMALSNVQVTERTSRGLTTSVTYTIRNFKLPFFRPLNNNLDVTLAGNLIEDTEQRFLLDSDISNAFSETHELIERDPSVYRVNPRPPSGQTRVNASTILGYRFSSRVQANFEYAFSHTLPKSSSTFRRTTHDFRFSIRINFRSV